MLCASAYVTIDVIVLCFRENVPQFMSNSFNDVSMLKFILAAVIFNIEWILITGML